MRRWQPDLRRGVPDNDRAGPEPGHQRGLHQPLVACGLWLVGIESDDIKVAKVPVRIDDPIEETEAADHQQYGRRATHAEGLGAQFKNGSR